MGAVTGNAFFASASQLADALPDGIVVVDASGRILSASARLEEMTGYPADELVGRSVDLLVPAEMRGSHAAHRTRYMAHPGVRPMGAELNIVCERADGSTFPADIALSPMDIGGELFVVATVRDATWRRAQEQARRDADERFRLLVESAFGTAIFMLDPAGNVETWNAGAQRLKGYSSEEIVGRNVSVFYTPDDIAAGKPGRVLAEAAATGRAEDSGWRVRKDGSRFQASASVTASYDADGSLRGFTKITRDISAAVRVREDLERLHLFEQREQLGRDLHDGVIQSVFAVGMGLQGLLLRIDDPMVAERLQQAVGALDDIITELRGFIFGLGTETPPARVQQEIERMVREVRARGGAEVTGYIEPEAVAALGGRAQDLLLVVREALSNVERHSRASTCRVTLRIADANTVELVVEDDGHGFDTAGTSAGLGLRNARARAAQMGADHVVESSSSGTRVTLRVPIIT